MGLRVVLAVSIFLAVCPFVALGAEIEPVVLPEQPAVVARPQHTGSRGVAAPKPRASVRPVGRRVPSRRGSVRRNVLRSVPLPQPVASSAQPLAPVAAPVPGASAPLDWGLYTREGRWATLDDVVAAARLADVIFVGEFHDDHGAHLFEKSLLMALMPVPGQSPPRPTALSLEMFDVDVQLALSEYLQGLVREKDFLAATRPWDNYSTDYRPLLEFARSRRVPVLAANAPHRYVIRVGRYGATGLDPLSSEAKSVLPPLPWPEASVAYDERFAAFAREALGLGAAGGHRASVSARYMFEAQWLRDITMASTIAKHLSAVPSGLVVHVTGLFHCQSAQGTVEALRHYRPGVRPLTIAVVRGEGDLRFVPSQMSQLGDFVVVSRQSKAP